MFMDRQELIYSLKFIKGDFKQRKIQNIYGICFLAFFSVMNVVMSSLNIFIYDTEMTNIVTFQNFSTSSIFAMVMFPIIYYVFTYRKTTTANQIYPQTNNTRFVKDFAIGFFIILLLIATYIFSYLGSFGVGHLISYFRTDTAVVSAIQINELLLSCFSLLMYGLLALSFFILCGAVFRKIKLFSLAFPLVIIVFLSAKFMQTLNLITKIANFYIAEGSVGLFAVKILVTFAVLMILAFIINNKTAVENSVNYKNIIAISFCVLFVLASAVSGFLVINVSFDDEELTLEPEMEVNTEESYFQKIEIDTSGIEKGTVLEFDLTNVTPESDYDYGQNAMRGSDDMKELTVTGDTLTVYYIFMENYDNLSFDIQDYTNESFTAYMEDNVVYLNYEVSEPLNLIYIDSSILINQFDITENNSYFSSFSYINGAYCFIEFE
ncbi:MAG: hypothetical protein R3Y35_09585 [Clostridia bacterium]